MSGDSTAGELAAAPPRHLYIHIPFCADRCDYCEFFSLALGSGTERRPDGEALLDRYTDAVVAEWEFERERLDVRRLESVFVGGGTPSLLGPERLERLFEPLQTLLTPQAEVTVETNPEDVDEAFARWAAARRLRVSLGVQSFVPRLRETLGRRAAADPAPAARRLRAAGVTNLGLDLIFAIPGQSQADIETDLEQVARLRPDHVSWYELGVVEGTPLAARLFAQPVVAPFDPDDAYRLIVRALERLGYRWYETSNFARPGRRCRHNSAVWRGASYLGLGPTAVSTVGARRWRNDADLEGYVAALADGDRPGRQVEPLAGATRARERLMLAARTGAAVPEEALVAVIDPDAAGQLAAAGFVSRRGGTLRVTRKGRYVANAVCVRLFRASSS